VSVIGVVLPCYRLLRFEAQSAARLTPRLQATKAPPGKFTENANPLEHQHGGAANSAERLVRRLNAARSGVYNWATNPVAEQAVRHGQQGWAEEQAHKAKRQDAAEHPE